MLLFVTLGTDDLSRAVAFYSPIFDLLGVPRLPGWTGTWACRGKDHDGGAGFWLCRPFDGAPAAAGNGTMIALPATSAAQVRAVHAAGLAHGGSVAGAPGIRDRYEPSSFVAYLDDPDGHLRPPPLRPCRGTHR